MPYFTPSMFRTTEPEKTGFGSRLIRRGLGTPGSRTAIEYLPDGLHCRLEGLV